MKSFTLREQLKNCRLIDASHIRHCLVVFVCVDACLQRTVGNYSVIMSIQCITKTGCPGKEAIKRV